MSKQYLLPATNGRAPLCYLATPYTKYPRGIHWAFADAAGIAGKLRLAGVDVYCPVVAMHPQAIYGGIDPLDLSIWLPANATMMRLSDVLIVAHMESWETSTGVTFEIEEFRKAGKPIFDCDPETLMLKKRNGAT